MIKVEFTKTAEEDYLALLHETSSRSLDEALELDAKLDTLIENLQKFKHLCPPSKNFPKFRRCVVTRFVSLVYEVGQQSVTIISVFDSRSKNSFSWVESTVTIGGLPKIWAGSFFFRSP